MNTYDPLAHESFHEDEMDLPPEACVEYSQEDYDDQFDENDHWSIDDMSFDAEGLASAGHGTDEDYGYYGGGDE